MYSGSGVLCAPVLIAPGLCLYGVWYGKGTFILVSSVSHLLVAEPLSKLLVERRDLDEFGRRFARDVGDHVVRDAV